MKKILKHSFIIIFLISFTQVFAEEISVEMLNKSGKEIMVFSKKIVRVKVGETVFWKATNKGHNVEFIKGGTPEGVSKFKSKNLKDIKFFGNCFLMQNLDKVVIDKKKMKCVTRIKPTKKDLLEIEFAFNICKHVKSNSIVLTNKFSTIGIGGGQPSRLDSCKIATQKAKQFQFSNFEYSAFYR